MDSWSFIHRLYKLVLLVLLEQCYVCLLEMFCASRLGNRRAFHSFIQFIKNINKFYMHSSAVRIILKEARIRVWWIFFCAFVTCATCYWFSEELLFILSKPYLKISKTNFFICTQITESLNTYITISIILGFFIVHLT